MLIPLLLASKGDSSMVTGIDPVLIERTYTLGEVAQLAGVSGQTVSH